MSQLTKRALAESLKALLAQKPLSKITISDITAHCGFTSFSQFNRVFNKFCHTSPSQFRLNGSAGITPANNYIQLPAESREA